MPTSAGPNIIGENNIILAYDTGDTVNSYKGEPTTNLYTTLGFGFYQQEGNHSAVRTTGPVPGLALPSNYDYTTVTATGNWQSEVNRLIIWTDSSLSSGTYNISFWARLTSTTSATIGCAFYGNGLNQSMSLTNQWQRFSIQSTTHPLYRATEFGSLSGAIVFQIAGLQIEAISHATSYVNGTRSVTQGLLPIIGSTSLDLSNTSFNSNAQITFDGTNDYVNTSSPSTYRMGTGDFTLECVMKQSKTTGHCLLEARGDNLKGYLWVMNISNTAGRMCLFLNDDIGGQHLFYQDGGYTATSTTQYYHLSVTVNRSTRKLIFYINGAQAGNEVTISHSNSISPSSGDYYHIGYDRGGSPWYGEIPVFKHYNKTLSAVEIQQNYKQYKSRFNLS